MLNEYGICVIQKVMNKDECFEIINGMWEYLEHATSKWETPINRNNKLTWNITDFIPLHSMLIQHYSIGHAQFVWNVRQNKNLVNVFKFLWDIEEVVTSYDGVSIHFPPEENGKPNCGYGRNPWYHSDQSYQRNDLECYQSWFTPVPVNNGDATLCVLEKSHKFHKNFAEKYKIKDKKDWYKLNDEEYKTYTEEYNCEPKRIKCEQVPQFYGILELYIVGDNPLKAEKIQIQEYSIHGNEWGLDAFF